MDAAMLLAKVIGTVVATRKDPSLIGLKFLLLRNVDMEGKPTGATVVAADAVGAGVDEMVLYASGSSAGRPRPQTRSPSTPW